MLRTKEILKQKGLTQKQLAKKLGWSTQVLNYRIKNDVSIKWLIDISNALDCEIHELFETSDDYAHFYDKGEWFGIRKK